MLPSAVAGASGVSGVFASTHVSDAVIATVWPVWFMLHPVQVIDRTPVGTLMGVAGSVQWCGGELRSDAPVTVADACPVLETTMVTVKIVLGGMGSGAVVRLTPASAAAVWTVRGAVTEFVDVPPPPTFASTQVALAERVPVVVAVQPVQVRVCEAAMLFTGAGAPVQETPAPESDDAVTLAAAWPVFASVSVTVKACPVLTVVADGTTELAVTEAAVWTVVAGDVVADAAITVPEPADVPFALAVKVIVPEPETVQVNV